MFWKRLTPLFFLILSSQVLFAHPHMWIKGRIEPQLSRKGLDAVSVYWDIDELTSSSLILDYDTNRDGELSSFEQEALRQNAFERLLESEYYLMVEVGSRLGTPDPAKDFRAHIENGHVIYEFTVPLDIPIRWEDLGETSIYFFDQSYFIDFRPEDMEPVDVSYRNRLVSFEPVQRRSMTMGYGMVAVTALAVQEILN
ncbi:MAG: DUF1007 family protein [Spirochaetales bacterium]|nr:DUF1007 family protein [Spirochaetales bacterium]